MSTEQASFVVAFLTLLITAFSKAWEKFVLLCRLAFSVSVGEVRNLLEKKTSNGFAFDLYFSKKKLKKNEDVCIHCHDVHYFIFPFRRLDPCLSRRKVLPRLQQR